MSNYEAGSAEWLAALDYPKHDRAEIQRNREMALKQGIVKKPVDPTFPQDRKAALQAIEREFGAWTYLDPTTVIAGGKKHTVPAGTATESGPSSNPAQFGPRGGVYVRTRSGGKRYI
ncbi:hypothetical protein SynRS9907_00953 [Synechococcus sp. RS9907]|uniref:hypothetical protein n=1 Tax=Synechococcus sp. RS9907 TaxID=221350 RepID=UPI00165D3D33|nr:hypothetical protein [Synechococcus sp. RS9907]QNI81801.1 hypothetical protein SynRS9907_00953 [Synechococcus sp. RS9907]